ncbi:MAG: thioredoxin domain-containing protein [Candidatus Aenigmatarchaeota archaeon]|nr:thioredoxin domain-containing protein [Candidatus Aenigmarchaeota archaeon]
MKHKEKHSESRKERNWWMYSTVLLSVVVIALVVIFLKPTSPQRVGNIVVSYINENLVQDADKATLSSVTEEAGMYKVITIYKGQEIPVYASKDGKFLFLSQPLDMSQTLPKNEDSTTGTFDAPDSNKPQVDLYVMSFCPYGVQAENTMKPVFDLLKNKADFNIWFIANVGGDTVDSIQSLHGKTEAMEDLRQICVMKNYDKTTLWNYIIEVNANCYSLYRDEKALDTCWRNAAKKFNINEKLIDDCSKSKEAVEIMKQHEARVNQFGVRGSPTLIINGATYNGARTPDSFKQAICSGFATKPTECSQTLESNTATVSGSC